MKSNKCLLSLQCGLITHSFQGSYLKQRLYFRNAFQIKLLQESLSNKIITRMVYV